MIAPPPTAEPSLTPPLLPAIHPVFHNFRCWSGWVPHGFGASFLGMLTDERFFSSSPMAGPEGTYFARTEYPLAGESCFDLICILEAVVEARDCFVMLELGAGYGVWTVTAGLAAKSRGLKCRLIAVEPEPGHFQILQRHVRVNGFEPSECALIEAAVSGEDGVVHFTTGHSQEWFGHPIVDDPNARYAQSRTR